MDGARRPPREDERPFFRAMNYARLGDADNAIKCLEQSYRERDGLMILLKAYEWFDPLRSDPRSGSGAARRDSIAEERESAMMAPSILYIYFTYFKRS